MQIGRLKVRGRVGDLNATAHPSGSYILLAPRSKTESLATLVLGSPQKSPALQLSELQLETVNPHLKGYAVVEGDKTQYLRASRGWADTAPCSP